jgi:transcriptional regulator with XRE-family HTH domain
MTTPRGITPDEEERWRALGKHLHALRRDRDWTQPALAKLSGVSEPTIRSIENRERTGTRQRPVTLTALSRAFGKPDDYFAAYLRDATLGDGPGILDAAQPSEPMPGSAPPNVEEILVSRLNEILVPRLESLEKQVRALTELIYDIAYNTKRQSEMDAKDSGDSE